MNQISESSNKREYYFENETGDARITVYDILPGVEVAFSSVHMDQFDFRETEPHYRDRYVGFYYCKIVYFIEHANVWYTSTGGVQALDTMLADLEGALLNK